MQTNIKFDHIWSLWYIYRNCKLGLCQMDWKNIYHKVKQNDKLVTVLFFLPVHLLGITITHFSLFLYTNLIYPGPLIQKASGLNPKARKLLKFTTEIKETWQYLEHLKSFQTITVNFWQPFYKESNLILYSHLGF